jgi:2OG-Fe(II) oxygenase superfamily
LSGLTRISQSPAVYAYEGFATPEECLHVERRGGHWNFIRECGIKTKHDETGFSFELPISGDPVLERLRTRFEAAVGLESQIPDTFRFRRYSPGEGHAPHVDCYDIDDLLLTASALLYLNEPESGGCTTFTHPQAESAGLALTPKRGTLALWFNYTADARPDPASTHRGDVVLAGTKATIAYFFYTSRSLAGHRP